MGDGSAFPIQEIWDCSVFSSVLVSVLETSLHCLIVWEGLFLGSYLLFFFLPALLLSYTPRSFPSSLLSSLLRPEGSATPGTPTFVLPLRAPIFTSTRQDHLQEEAGESASGSRCSCSALLSLRLRAQPTSQKVKLLVPSG